MVHPSWKLLVTKKMTVCKKTQILTVSCTYHMVWDLVDAHDIGFLNTVVDTDTSAFATFMILQLLETFPGSPLPQCPLKFHFCLHRSFLLLLVYTKTTL
jgi:hypothetical protein